MRIATILLGLSGLVASEAGAAEPFGPEWAWYCPSTEATFCKAGSCGQTDRQSTFHFEEERISECGSDGCDPGPEVRAFHGPNFVLINSIDGSVTIEVRRDLSFTELRYEGEGLFVFHGRCKIMAPSPKLLPKS